MITAYLLPTWKYRKPHEITRRDVRAVIDEIARSCADHGEPHARLHADDFQLWAQT